MLNDTLAAGTPQDRFSTGTSGFVDQRKRKRYKMELPLSITWAGSEEVRLAGFTLDISSHGVLFACRRRPDVGGAIIYLIRLPVGGPGAVEIRCAGRVLRADLMSSDRDRPRREYRVAATLERYWFERSEGG